MEQPIAERIARIYERIAAAAHRAQRTPEAVRLIGISKTHPAERIVEAYAAGLRDFGESRVQEMEHKHAEFSMLASVSDITWHLIGHLQSNKAKKAASLFNYVQTVDSTRLATALAKSHDLPTPNTEHRLPILLQVNVSGEASKEGFALAGWQENSAIFEAFCGEVEHMLTLPNLQVRGLMTIAPYGVDPLPTFRSARRLQEALAQRFPNAAWNELSMGMSDDFEAAIAEGATMVRVGRAIFGER